MIRYITVLGFICLASSSLNGQVWDYQQQPGVFTFGPRAGFVTSTLTGNDLGSKQLKIGYTVGGFARYQLSNKWALEGQAALARRGVNLRSGNLSNLSDQPLQDIDLTYLDLPLVANFNFDYRLFGKKFNTDVFLGGQVSRLLQAQSGDTELYDALNKTEFTIVLGSGFNLGRFLLYGTTKIGLSNINDTLLTAADGVNLNSSRFKSISSEWTVAYRIGK